MKSNFFHILFVNQKLTIPDISAPGLFQGLSSMVSMLNSRAGTPFMLPGPSRSSSVALLPAAGPGRGFSPPAATRPTPRYNLEHINIIISYLC